MVKLGSQSRRTNRQRKGCLERFLILLKISGHNTLGLFSSFEKEKSLLRGFLLLSWCHTFSNHMVLPQGRIIPYGQERKFSRHLVHGRKSWNRKPVCYQSLIQTCQKNWHFEADFWVPAKEKHLEFLGDVKMVSSAQVPEEWAYWVVWAETKVSFLVSYHKSICDT